MMTDTGMHRCTGARLCLGPSGFGVGRACLSLFPCLPPRRSEESLRGCEGQAGEPRAFGVVDSNPPSCLLPDALCLRLPQLSCKH